MVGIFLFFFFKQKTAYEMRISDWSSDVCSSDLGGDCTAKQGMHGLESIRRAQRAAELDALGSGQPLDGDDAAHVESDVDSLSRGKGRHADVVFLVGRRRHGVRSEEHTSELQSLMRI